MSSYESLLNYISMAGNVYLIHIYLYIYVHLVFGRGLIIGYMPVVQSFCKLFTIKYLNWIEIFPNVTKLLTIACTLPITSCEAERAFSTLRKTKTYLRTTMGEERLSGLALMNVHNGVDISDVCKRFITKHPRRMFRKNLLTEEQSLKD